MAATSLRDESLNRDDPGYTYVMPTPTTTELIDALCLCREFSTPRTLWKDTKLSNNDDDKDKDKDIHTDCSDLGVWERWKRLSPSDLGVGLSPSTSSSSSSHLGLDFNDRGEVVRPGGLHALVFRSIQDPATITIGFRHQEGTRPWDSDMLEAMGLWGSNQVRQWFPDTGSFGLAAAFALQKAIHGIRRSLGRDYFTQSEWIVRGVVEALTDKREEWESKSESKSESKLESSRVQLRLRFVGYSLGGAVAQLQALRNPGAASAVVFASVGVADVAELLYPSWFGLESAIGGSSDSHSHSDRNSEPISAHSPRSRMLQQSLVVNVFEESDAVPTLDCQFGTVCPFSSAEDASSSGDGTGDPERAHTGLVYGPYGLRALLAPGFGKTCVRASEFNRERSVCWSQRHHHHHHHQDEQPNATVQLVLVVVALAMSTLWFRRTAST